ncbi:MAG: winged helix-turn-helix transcriptional regulator [Candidatus Eisenbacteria bacterium]|uniref:Winged helix-turn-helix transcriptional regulator n=1 Tax=Eiseniibacteriota bacterium TaxID=2212470 RepID=A0A937X7Q4_UNCEI|nr:winged helix-turn-helix transcriptional regulator [Candidatus Eisenbacteria bacterium]
MDHRQRNALRARAAVIKALGHPTRLLLVEALARRERCVAELTGMAEADMSTVSKHLAILREAGIVDGARRGAQVYYSLRVPCILDFFGCVEAVLLSAADESRDVARACCAGRPARGAAGRDGVRKATRAGVDKGSRSAVREASRAVVRKAPRAAAREATRATVGKASRAAARTGGR